MKKELVAVGFVFFSLMLPLKASAANFSQMFMFGDSLSDEGNVFNVTQGAIPSLIDYPQGNGGYTNGRMWVDYLATQLDLKPTLYTNFVTQPFPLPQQGINYAFGGSSTGLVNAASPESGLPGILAQVGLYTSSFQQADPNALYAVWGAANDFLFFNPPNATTAVNNISQALETLAIAGAKNLLVFNLPNMAQLPDVKLENLDPESLRQLTIEFNQGLADNVARLNTTYGLDIITVDAFSLFNQAIASPSSFGLTNVTDACYVPAKSIFCSNPEEYLFWNAVHPTTDIHKLIANTALDAIKSKQIPEPSAPLGMLTLGAIGAAMLKRQQKKLHITPTNQALDAQSSHIKVES
jgi:phospholipase/lecithinase/hemolysin